MLQVQACLDVDLKPTARLLLKTARQMPVTSSQQLGAIILSRLKPQLRPQPLPQAPSPASAPVPPPAVPSAAAMAAAILQAALPGVQAELPLFADTLATSSLELSPAPRASAPAAPALSLKALLPALQPHKQEPLLQSPLLPELLGRRHTSSLPHLLQLTASELPPATSHTQLPKLSAAHELDQLLDLDFTMRACPSLLPLPYLDISSSYKHQACRLVITSVPAQSTAHLELYLDWSSTSSALTTAVRNITEAHPTPLPRSQHATASLGGTILAAVAVTPPGLLTLLSAHRARSCSAAQAWLAAYPRSRAHKPCLPPAAAKADIQAPCPDRPAPQTGLGYFVSLQQRPQAAPDQAPAAAHMDPSPGGPQHHPAAETLTVELPASHLRLLQRLQACNAEVLASSTGLSPELGMGSWLQLTPVQAGLDAAAAAETAQPGRHQHALRAHAALLAVRHTGLCLLHFGIR